MAGRITLWGASQLLRTFFSKELEPPASFYLAVIGEVAPNAFVGGGELAEPEAADYQRVEIPNDVGFWVNDGQPQILASGLEILFLTAMEDWGRIKYWALCDAPADGNVYFIGDIEENLVVVQGDTLSVASGDLSISLGPFFTTTEES